MRFWCRMGFHHWKPWEVCDITRMDDVKILGQKRFCFYCNVLQVRPVTNG